MKMRENNQRRKREDDEEDMVRERTVETVESDLGEKR